MLVAFGIFYYIQYSLNYDCNCGANVGAVQTPSVWLYSSNDTIVFRLDNPLSATSVSNITLSANSTEYRCFLLSNSSRVPTGFSVMAYLIWPELINGSVYNFALSFANGDAVSGSLISYS
jgi:hypothetical protein